MRGSTRLFTIGHSNHELDHFIELLKKHGITAIADVRSEPYSRFNSQFNRESLKTALRPLGIAYAFLGGELGARRKEPQCYEGGVAQYALIAKTIDFAKGLSRIRKGLHSHRVALMCAEKDPLDCHRMILVCRHLRSPAITIAHILEDGSLESMENAEDRLLRLYHSQGEDLFRSREELIEEAYERRAERLQYVAQEGCVGD